MNATRAPRVNGERLWRRHSELAALGATPRGGVNRAALSPQDIEVHRRMAAWASDLGFAVLLDDYGNTFFRREGEDAQRAQVVSGSHSDTQPTGGRFDGIFGVLAAFEALQTIEEAGIDTARPLEAVIWNNEEGARFKPSAMGSAVYVGAADLECMLDAVDSDGCTMRTSVAALKDALPDAGQRSLGEPFAAFVEAHIEQGPILEREGIPIGVVTGIQGTRKFEVEVTGEEAHAGTMPRAGRRDALVDAIAIVNRLHEIFHDEADEIRFTIGRFEVHPGAGAVVPGRVRFSIDFRHPEESTLARLGDQVEPVAQDAVTRCRVRVIEPTRAGSTEFSPEVPDAIVRAAESRGYRWRHIYSGAGHDARYMATHCPAGMVFVPCEGGISHNERENANPQDLEAGAQVVADVLLDLSERL